MARDDWREEIDDALKVENWSLEGPNRVVKVVPFHYQPRPTVDGYITLAKYLGRRTPAEVEKDFGLPENFLQSGMRVYSLARLPRRDEVSYELTAKYPGGLAYNPAHGDDRYKPGKDHILQWEIRKGAGVPVNPNTIILVAPGGRFPG